MIPAGRTAGFNPAARQVLAEATAPTSFPNSGSGTPVRETPFRGASSNETEFPGSAFPNGNSGTRADDAGGYSTPFFFEQNIGQADPDFDFVARGPGYTLGLRPTEAVMATQMPDASRTIREIDHLNPQAKSGLLPNGRRIDEIAPNPADAPMVRMQIVGGNTEAQVKGVDPLVTKINYFIGNDPSQWHTRVSTFARVQYDDVYPGIDLAYYGQGQDLEYDFIVGPGADPSRIALSFAGADAVDLDAGGNLVVQVGDTQIRQNAPYIYQEVDGSRQQVAGSFQIRSQDAAHVTFDISSYDHSRPLVIDPMVLGYSTYLGGPSSDYAWDIAADEFGNAYTTGSAYADFPLSNPTFTYQGGGDAFLSKFSPNGSLLYSTYIGGSFEDEGDSVAVDGKGNAYVTGYTLSGNFPSTPGAFQPQNADGDCNGNTDCSDAFVAKIGGPDGTSLLYSTYLGGIYVESGEGIAVDSTGNAYVMGMTASDDFPVLNPIQGFGGGNCGGLPCSDVFITNLNSTGSALVYSTYLGGVGDEGYFFHEIGDIAVDLAGHAYITGQTGSVFNFPIYHAIDPTAQSLEAFATKLTPDGTSFVYSTFLGGYPGDIGRSITADAGGNTYVTGMTCAPDFPVTPDTFQPLKSYACDGFITKLTQDGSAYVYSTFLGGSGEWDDVRAVAADSAGNAYVSGYTYSSDFPTKLAFSPDPLGSVDAFVSKLSADGKKLIYSSYLGGAGSEGAFGIAIDKKGNAYVTGNTDSDNFPTVNPFQPEKGGIGKDAFVTKISRFGRETPVLYQP